MDETLDAQMNNYLASVVLSAWEISIIYCELSTGELKYQTCEHSLVALQKALKEQYIQEVVVAKTLDKVDGGFRRKLFSFSPKENRLQAEDEKLCPSDASDLLKQNCSQLMAYLKDTQKQHIDHFMPMGPWMPNKF